MSEFNVFDPNPPVKPERLRRRLFRYPRPTQYQEFCLRIADKSLDLPVHDWCSEVTTEGRRLRDSDHLDYWAVQRWILEAIELNGLAAMVMLDAMDFFSDCLHFLSKDHDKELFDSRFKRDFTQSIQGLPFVFRIPAGWELSLFHDGYDEGNYGVGHVQRCHLSQSTQENWGWSKLLGLGNAHSNDIGYFDVPCEIVPHFKRMPIDADDERWGIGIKSVAALIPYQWIIHTRRREEDKRQFFLQAAPSEGEIIDVATKAIDAVKKRIAEIQDHRREAMKDQDGYDQAGNLETD